MEAVIIYAMMVWSIMVLVTWIGDDMKQWKREQKRRVRRCER